MELLVPFRNSALLTIGGTAVGLGDDEAEGEWEVEAEGEGEAVPNLCVSSSSQAFREFISARRD